MKSTTTFGIPYKTCEEIRSSFISFFVERGHKFVPSSSIVPHDDPTILFTNSGMNQFKALFLGDQRSGLKRAANSQKCLRVSGKHNDLDEVGRDGTHHTFFEMLGNWSFGDYYKKEAIQWAWALLTEVWKFPKERLFVSVHTSDDEARKLWTENTDISPNRILSFDKENFWEMGAVGPCGPCSEIHFDRGDLATQNQTFADPVHGVNGQNERYMEIWNLVFMQYERLQDGSLKKLASTHVDTGSGLERICSVIQGKNSNYDTDAFSHLIQRIAELAKTPYSQGPQGMPHRVMADHIRALSFAIADGATPGSEGRGYVLRRILRRASRFAYMLGQKDPFLFRLVPTLAEQMKSAYPEVFQRQDYIMQVLESEELRFLRTLGQGLSRIDKLVEDLKAKNQRTIPGRDVFLFHDTFGFPSDLTQIIAEEHGLSIDSKGFDEAMSEQQDRARKSQKFASDLASDEGWSILQPGKETIFVGHETLECDSKVMRFRENADTVYVVLDRSPLYAEGGGQVGDQGYLKGQDVLLRVEDTFKVFDMHVHACKLAEGLLDPQTFKTLKASVNAEQRSKTVRNHSATHLLQAALRKVLGDHVNQQGSYVGPDRLRFDFTHHQGVKKHELNMIEDMVNAQIRQNSGICATVERFDEVKGATALFGEKYGEVVRVLTMGEFSKELCGGTHAKATGDIALFKITNETSIAAGVRRIEGVTGEAAMQLWRSHTEMLTQLANGWKVPQEKLFEKLEQTQSRLELLEKDNQRLIKNDLQQKVDHLLSQKIVVANGYNIVVANLPKGSLASEHYQSFLDVLAASLKQEVAVLTSVEGDDLAIFVAVAPALLKKFAAGNLIKELCLVCQGRGGGRLDRARAGAKISDPKVIETVLEKAKALLLSPVS